MLWLVIAVAGGFYLAERLWPAGPMPKVRAWWGRVILVNLVQLGIILLAGISWDSWLARHSLFRLSERVGDVPAAVIAYFVSTFIYYWWHRFRHESQLFWRLCHQLHHSPRRIELVTSFYKHPVEILLNSILSALIVYTLLGCSVTAAAGYTFLTAVAEFFYHWNVRTPRWIGFLVQRPESHRVHHRYRHHTQNFADLPIWDMLFGTFLIRISRFLGAVSIPFRKIVSMTYSLSATSTRRRRNGRRRCNSCRRALAAANDGLANRSERSRCENLVLNRRRPAPPCRSALAQCCGCDDLPVRFDSNSRGLDWISDLARHRSDLSCRAVSKSVLRHKRSGRLRI